MTADADRPVKGEVPAMRAALASLVADVYGCEVEQIAGLHALSGGTSRDTWSFDAVLATGERHGLVLQRRRTLAMATGIDIEAEAQVLDAAGSCGAAVPRLLAWDADGGRRGLPFLLLTRIDGETIPQRILRGPEFEAARSRLAGDYGRALARLQAVPTDQLSRLVHENAFDHYRRIYEDIAVPHPALELGFRWLERNRPTPGGDVLVHGDYRNGNGIVGQEGLRAIIDFELAHLGDPLEDLGWFCIRAWRFGAAPIAGGFGAIEDLVGGYEEIAGRAVDRETLRWWQVLGTVRWAVICMMQGATQLSGHRRSIELAAVGRRTSEPEFDLMLLLP
jgi:aminoglycoside phosphotransferase (APT) family kinase protein